MQRSAMLYIPLLTFLIRYRRTALGPLWLIVGPSLFIAVLGYLYAEIGASPPEQFIPHLAVGLVTWTLIGEFTNKAPTVYQRGRANIMQGGMPLGDIVLIDAMTTVISFLHQLVIFIPVFLIYSIPLTAYSLVSILGCGLLIVNGILFTRILRHSRFALQRPVRSNQSYNANCISRNADNLDTWWYGPWRSHGGVFKL